MNNEEIIKLIPESLKDFVYIHDGEVCAKQKLPVELESEYEKLQRRLKQPRCAKCGTILMF